MKMTDITIRTAEYRPCFVDGEKALFHRWEEESYVIPPSVMVGGHNGGEIKRTLAIVECEDGTINRVEPTRIKFVAGEIKNYSFE